MPPFWRFSYPSHCSSCPPSIIPPSFFGCHLYSPCSERFHSPWSSPTSASLLMVEAYVTLVFWFTWWCPWCLSFAFYTLWSVKPISEPKFCLRKGKHFPSKPRANDKTTAVPKIREKITPTISTMIPTKTKMAAMIGSASKANIATAGRANIKINKFPQMNTPKTTIQIQLIWNLSTANFPQRAVLHVIKPIPWGLEVSYPQSPIKGSVFVKVNFVSVVLVCGLNP